MNWKNTILRVLPLLGIAALLILGLACAEYSEAPPAPAPQATAPEPAAEAPAEEPAEGEAAETGTVLYACSMGCEVVDEPGQCSKCGMDVDAAPRWTAGLTREDGTDLRFCSPRCMFAWMLKEDAAGTAWVTEYYSQRRLPAAGLYFVIGSDVIGPMGDALVPVRGLEAAEQFRKDHDGEKVLGMSEITIELLQSLKKRSN